MYRTKVFCNLPRPDYFCIRKISKDFACPSATPTMEIHFKCAIIVPLIKKRDILKLFFLKIKAQACFRKNNFNEQMNYPPPTHP